MSKVKERKREKPLEVKCPTCGYQHRAAPNVAGFKPKPGDITICFNCAEVLEFDKDRNPIVATLAGLMALDTMGSIIVNHAQHQIRSRGRIQ
jgi:hypothetical protein